MVEKLTEIKKGQTGRGILIEQEGFLTLNEQTKKLYEDLHNTPDEEWNVPNPFIVDAVFQKYGIENANGRIYPEMILKREVEKYQANINQKMAYGECYTPDAKCLTKEGWKSIVDVKEGDEILTLNTETNGIETQKVTYKTEADWDGDIYHVHSIVSVDDRLTPNHSYPIYSVEDGKLVFDKFITVEELSKKEKNSEMWLPASQNVDGDAAIFVDVSCADFEKEHYKGKVYCVEVPNHTWYVMQNGKCHWTKNCNHPSETVIDLGRICMNIIELHWENHTLVGKMEIETSYGFRKFGIISCLGDTIANHLLHGYKIGVSSRGVGSVEQKFGKLIVGDDYELICWDVVSSPSTNSAWIVTNSEELAQYVENTKTEKPLVEETDVIKKMENIMRFWD